MDPYDAVPYSTAPDPKSHPAILGAVGIAAGLESAPAEECRVLELGCGDGGHLLPMAYALRDATFVGVERAPLAAEAATRAARELGLSNLVVHARDLMDVEPDEVGTFDYVIAHGVLSWVPEPVRHRLFQLINGCLADRGLAYVSYNAPPGWALRGEIRETLLAHVRGMPILEQVREARRALSLWAEVLAGEETPHAALLRQEIELARNTPDAHLAHDYLAEVNVAFREHEVRKMAAAHGLAPVRELAPMTRDGIREPSLRHALAQRGFGPLAVTCATDLLLYRQLRRTVFARSSHASRWDPARAVRRGHISALLRPREGFDPTDGAPEAFEAQGGVTVTLERDLEKRALAVLFDAWPSTRSFDELSRGADEASVDALAANLAFLWEADHASVRNALVIAGAAVPERPLATTLARVEASRHGWVSTLHHEHAALDALERCVLDRANGERDAAALERALIDAVRSGDLAVLHEGVAVGDPQLEAAAPSIVRATLTRLVSLGALER